MSAPVLLSKIMRLGPHLSHVQFRFLVAMADRMKDGKSSATKDEISDQCRFHDCDIEDLRNTLRWNSPLKAEGIEVSMSCSHCFVSLVEESQS